MFELSVFQSQPNVWVYIFKSHYLFGSGNVIQIQNMFFENHHHNYNSKKKQTRVKNFCVLLFAFRTFQNAITQNDLREVRLFCVPFV
jgi:hypothetical protein